MNLTIDDHDIDADVTELQPELVEQARVVLACMRGAELLPQGVANVDVMHGPSLSNSEPVAPRHLLPAPGSHQAPYLLLQQHLERHGVFAITLFTDVSFLAIPEVLLRCQEMYFELCPRERLRFYADENMRKHRPVGPKTFGMLESSLRNPQDKDGIVALELKDGEHALDAPKHLFKVYGRDRDRRGDPDQLANSLCMTFAPEDGLARVRDMAALVRRIAEIFPYRSGCAGFGYQVSRYSSEVGESFAWQKSMRHPQMDIVRSLQDRHAVANNAGKTVNWLTLVCDELLRELGSPKNVEQTLEAPIEWTHLGAGVLFQLGASPGFIDRTRGETAPDYHRLHRLLRPLIERAREQSPWFATGSSDDQAERTDDWFRRFDRA